MKIAEGGVAVSAIFVDKESFKELYYRSSSRSNGQRNIRCFPSCSIVHNENNFCGKALRITVTIRISKESLAFRNNYNFDKICVVGEYKSLNYQSNLVSLPLKGSELGAMIKSKKNMHRTLYWGKLVKKLPIENPDESTVVYSASYDFNSELRGWHYPINGRFRGDEQHCFSATLLSLDFQNSNSLANLRDSTQMENMFENDTFYPIGNYDSPSFRFGLFRSNSQKPETKKEGESSTKGTIPEDHAIMENVVGKQEQSAEIKTDDDNRGIALIENSTKSAILEIDQSKGLPDNSSTIPNNVVVQSKSPKVLKSPSKKPVKRSSRSLYDTTIFGLPSSIFEGIDYSPAALLKFGFPDDQYAATSSNIGDTASFLSTLPKNSVLSTLVKGKLPTLQHSRVFFPPPPPPPPPAINSNSSSSAPQYQSSSQSSKYGNTIANISHIPSSQRALYQHYPLVNIRYFINKYALQPQQLASYVPPVYRIFQPVIYYDNQSAMYKAQFTQYYERLMKRNEPTTILSKLQKLTIDFWQNKFTFPISIEPILLFFYFLNDKEKLLSQYRLSYIIHRSSIFHAANDAEAATAGLTVAKSAIDIKSEKIAVTKKRRGRPSRKEVVTEKEPEIIIDIDEDDNNPGFEKEDQSLDEQFEQLFLLVSKEFHYLRKLAFTAVPSSSSTPKRKAATSLTTKGKRVKIKEESIPIEVFPSPSTTQLSKPDKDENTDFSLLYTIEEMFIWLSYSNNTTSATNQNDLMNQDQRYYEFHALFLQLSAELRAMIRLFFQRMFIVQSLRYQQKQQNEKHLMEAQRLVEMKRQIVEVRHKRKWVELEDVFEDPKPLPVPLLPALPAPAPPRASTLPQSLSSSSQLKPKPSIYRRVVTEPMNYRPTIGGILSTYFQSRPVISSVVPAISGKDTVKAVETFSNKQQNKLIDEVKEQDEEIENDDDDEEEEEAADINDDDNEAEENDSNDEENTEMDVVR